MFQIIPRYSPFKSIVSVIPFLQTKKCSVPILGFIGLAIALPPPSVHEVRLETDMFVTRLAFDFKIAHCEPK
jgi:neuronal PAS domain-containing protein 1/3